MSVTKRNRIARTQITRNEEGEYHVKAYTESGNRLWASDYYTDDLQDANETALAMRQRWIIAKAKDSTDSH